MATARASQSMLTEAKRAGFTFRLYEGDVEQSIPADQVEIGPFGITFSEESGDRHLPYNKISVQILAASRIASIIVSPSTGLLVLVYILPLLIAGILFQVGILFDNPLGVSNSFIYGFSSALTIASYGVMLFGFWYIRHIGTQREIRAVSSAAPLIAQLDRVSDVEEYFSRLIQVNLKNMDQYYLLVRNQTEKSYRLTQTAAAVGFIILIAGIILSFRTGLDSAPTALTVASGTMVEFISAIFFYIYNRTIRQLNTYHDKLVSVQDTMLALKVAQIVNNVDLKDKTMAFLTRALTRRMREFEMVVKDTPAAGTNQDKRSSIFNRSKNPHNTMGQR